MKIAYISDLHNEFLRDAGLPVPDIKLNEPVDVLVLAGDIDVKEYGAQYAVRQSQHLELPVIYVLGNHEFYQADSLPVKDKVESLTRNTDVHFLDSDTAIIDDVMFIGATLWTDFMLFGSAKHHLAISHASFNMTDYSEIRLPDKPFSPKLTVSDTLLWHKLEKQFIDETLMMPAAKSIVVVTHHAPSLRCLPVHEQSDLISAAYASRLDSLIENHKPTAWIYGHVHGENSFNIGTTRICRHAQGYPHLQTVTDTAYQPAVIHIDEKLSDQTD